MKNTIILALILFTLLSMTTFICRAQEKGFSYRISQENFLDLSIVDEEHFWLSGIGLVMCTSDGGTSWRQINKVDEKEWYNGVFFLDQTNGWVCGSEGTLLRTTDGGRVWTRSSIKDCKLLDIHFTSNRTGLTCGMDGIMMRTSDGGTTWSRINVPTDKYLNRIASFENELLIAVGGEGTILRSKSGGLTWESLQSSVSLTMSDVCILEKNIIWICGDQGTVITSPNRGTTWESKSINANIDLSAIHFFNNSHGITVGGSTDQEVHLYSTKDSGATWQEIEMSSRKWWKSLECLSREFCIISGNDVVMQLKTK